MATALNPNLVRTFDPPIVAARGWLRDVTFPPARPLLDLSQAAPVDPPPTALKQAMAEALLQDPDAHLYGPVLGNTDLRGEIAAQWTQRYGGPIVPDQVAVTAGCNQAFCTAVMTLCAPGDAILLPVPWYFNHKMWLDMAGVEARPIPCDANMLPDLDAAAAAMDDRVKGVLLITPNNPTGAEYPDALMTAFFDLAARHDAALIVDETYRDFHSMDGSPHRLFQRPDWGETLIHLYSFSKVFRLTGHRTGAMITGQARIAQAEKFLDTVTICPAQTGQIGALYGLSHLGDWVVAERAEILARRAALAQVFAEALPDWRLNGCGAYFAWAEAPFGLDGATLAQRLVAEQSLLVLPGAMFMPDGHDTRCLRIAFANADAAGLAEMGRRLAAFRP